MKLHSKTAGERLCALMLAVVLCAEPFPRQSYAQVQTQEREQELGKIHALGAVLMDGESGRILWGKEEDVARPMASTTKIMTCILALENGAGDEICLVSKEAASQPKVHLGARAGSEFYLKDLLYSLMLESHNDTAVILAEHIAGSTEQFAEMMNQKARDIGCADTWFVTPNGLDAAVTLPDQSSRVHSTTAADLARILRYCVMLSPAREEFLRITQTLSYSFSDVSGTHSYSCVNHNTLLTQMDGVLTGKTGFTGGAGYTYVAAIESDGRVFIAALLGSGWPPHRNYRWEDVRALFAYGKEHYRLCPVYEPVGSLTIPVRDGVRAGEIAVEERDLEKKKGLEVLMADDEQVERRVELKPYLQAPVHVGDLAGQVVYRLGGETLGVWPLYAAEEMELWSLRYCLEGLVRCFLVSALHVG